MKHAKPSSQVRPTRPTSHANRALDQGAEAIGVVMDFVAPGLREKFERATKREAETIAPQAGDVDTNLCETCEGGGELQTFTGKRVDCPTCEGKGSR